jgi:hypothetical protein
MTMKTIVTRMKTVGMTSSARVAMYLPRLLPPEDLSWRLGAPPGVVGGAVVVELMFAYRRDGTKGGPPSKEAGRPFGSSETLPAVGDQPLASAA